MADVNLQLVREFFELCMFRVLTNWQQEPLRERAADTSPQLFVENVNPAPAAELPFLLRAGNAVALERAVVHVRAWHADRFYPSVIESSPLFSRIEADQAGAVARRLFGDAPFATLLVVSELPVSREQRERSQVLLRESGVDHVLEFPAMLAGLLERVSVNGNYAASATLQTLRLLKRYKLVRNQQLELPFRVEPPVPPQPPRVEVSNPSPEEPAADDEEE
jgi:hypothetical protein